ncbi:hypothetical protein MSG28_007346 [Choristoneura fumiferana]|uniref:Uncharacterized protein n=1 Tax=Choristoneura fumiferana TaxID=7141 RepID=A0ACC0JWV7_CHOFU|nr:hypothetical protein MSG28_007346 [Choristoneura fumiferana]
MRLSSLEIFYSSGHYDAHRAGRATPQRPCLFSAFIALLTVVPEPVISSPRPLGQQSPLPGIEEEDDSDWPLEDATDATLTPSYKSTRSSTDTAYTSSRSSGKKRSFSSTSAVKICISATARKSGNARKRGSGAGSVSPSGPPAPPGEEAPAPTGRMQAEQGSIGELQKYHGRYLKSRRHTLANVR